jgi:hypothetical protein
VEERSAEVREAGSMINGFYVRDCEASMGSARPRALSARVKHTSEETIRVIKVVGVAERLLYMLVVPVERIRRSA